VIDGSIAMVLIGAAIQAVPPVRGIVSHVRCRPAAARGARAARSSQPTSMTGEPART